MSPPPGSRAARALPDSRPALQRGGINTRATGGWEMARRATRPLAAMLACAALALPAAILVTGQPAEAAATGHQTAAPPISIAITSMSPQWATSHSPITVSGTVHNNSRIPIQPTVQLFDSPTPVASVGQLQLGMDQPYLPLTNGAWHLSRPLAPGATADWSIRVPASAIGMTTFGVYPLTAQVENQSGTSLDKTTTYLPYEPDRKGSHAGARPTPAKIAWLWPLVDVPLLNEPWQDNCSGAQASALAQSLGQNGRLGELTRAGSFDPDVTWVIDPAVLANVQALTTCQSTQPQWAKAASTWLSGLRSGTLGRPMTVTPYGDPNAAALMSVHRGYDVKQSFSLGRQLATEILQRKDLDPAAAGGATSNTAAPLTQAAGIAWVAAGVPSYGTLENLANANFVSTVVISTSAFPGGQYSVLKTPNGGGPYITALLASQSLTQLLGSRSSAPGSAFSTGQLFLAETALLAQQGSAQPIVVAPPPRWAPQAGLAAGLLADTSRAPWLSQVSLTSLASAKHIPIVLNANWPAGSLGATRITRPELRKLRMVNREIGQLQAIRAHPDPELYLALSSLESSALQGASADTVDAMLATVYERITHQEQGVRVVAEKRITLGGLKGSVPVSIENNLGYPVKVALQLQYNQSTGIKITADPQGPVTIPARQTQTIRLRVQATDVGSTTVTMLLATQGGGPVSVPLRMTIQATQVGILGMIIFAIALGIFLVASAARAVRRDRPGPGGDQASTDPTVGDHDGGGSADPAEADTVEAERAELGAAGKPPR